MAYRSNIHLDLMTPQLPGIHRVHRRFARLRGDPAALGCVAYWMLTGRYVFTADTALQIVARHVHTPPSAPSKHSPIPIPAELEEIVMACLAKEPSGRPASARELCDRLGRCEVDAAWTRDDARRWWETRMEAETAVTFSD